MAYKKPKVLAKPKNTEKKTNASGNVRCGHLAKAGC